jgi:SAM-dependent methyltransferase
MLLSKDGFNFSIATKYRQALSPSVGEHYIGNWISSLDYFQSVLIKLNEAVMTSKLTIDPSTHSGGDRENTREFALGMHNYATFRGRELAHFLTTTGCRSLLDLDCGPGTYAFHLALQNPDLIIYLLDVPDILEIAEEVQAKYSLKNEIHYLALDALKDDIPGTYDMILVSNMLHGIGELASRTLLQRLFFSTNPGGSVVIQGQYLQDDRLGGRWPIFLDLIMLCATAKGKNPSHKETRLWLEEAGFRDLEKCPMTLFNTNSFLRGYRPKE